MPSAFRVLATDETATGCLPFPVLLRVCISTPHSSLKHRSSQIPDSRCLRPAFAVVATLANHLQI